MFLIMGIKTNFLYNLFLTLSNYIVGLIILGNAGFFMQNGILRKKEGVEHG